MGTDLTGPGNLLSHIAGDERHCTLAMTPGKGLPTLGRSSVNQRESRTCLEIKTSLSRLTS